MSEARYLPTPEQIQAECAAIRAGWDAATEAQRRLPSMDECPWVVPQVREPKQEAQ